MNVLRSHLKAVSLLVLVLHLLLPAIVHAHSQTLLQADDRHSSHAICLDVDDTSHDSSGNHEHDSGDCQFDNPFDRTGPPPLRIEAVVGNLESPVNGKLLPGFDRRIYIPPRLAS